jgi:stage II sporulation protein B
VDKPTKGNTITIKINGDHRTFQEELQKIEPEESVDHIHKAVDINSNPSEPADVFSETAVAQESVDDRFDWIIPESSDNDIEEFQFNNHPTSKKSGHKRIASFSKNTKNKNGPSSIGPVFISALFAIFIGTAIGFFMLKLVITEPGKKAAADPKPVETMGGTDQASESAKTTSASIGQMTTYIIQGGIYSSADGAKETVKQLAAKGIPSQFISMKGKTYIFLGVADSIETAKSISDQYKQNGAEDAFAKPLLVDGKKLSDLSKTEKSFIEAMPAFYKTLSNAAATALVSNALAGDSAKAVAAMEKQLTIYDIKNSKVKKLQAELISAADKIKAFQKEKDAKSLTDAEQHLLNYLSLYYSL